MTSITCALFVDESLRFFGYTLWNESITTKAMLTLNGGLVAKMSNKKLMAVFEPPKIIGRW